VPLRALRLLLAASLVVLVSACGESQQTVPGQLPEPEEFQGFPLYAPGKSFEDAPLETVRRRPGYVEFTYGSDPPLRVQVWPGCVRNPLLRPDVLVEGAAFERTIVVRGATAYVFQQGRRLEVPLRGATVVIRARDLREARRAARALEGVNKPLAKDDRLPAAAISATPPFRTCRMNDPEAARVAAALKEALVADGQPAPPIVQCGRSLAVARGDGVEDAHDCFSGAPGGEASSWCVLSDGDNIADGTLALTCEAAVRQGAIGRPLREQGSVAWGIRARAACEPHLARVAEVLAGLDGDRLAADFSYVWQVMGEYEAGVVADLRALPAPPPEAAEIIARYEARIVSIEAAVAQYHAGGEEQALATFQRLEGETPALLARFEALGAGACAPPW
jgi:hypothetical protein